MAEAACDGRSALFFPETADAGEVARRLIGVKGDGFHGLVIRFSIRVAARQQGTVSQVYFFYGVVLDNNWKTVLSHFLNL